MHPDPHEITGTIATPRHQLVRYRAGPESGCVFDCDDTPGCGKCFDGLTLTLEIADMADARAMLAALSQSAAANPRLTETYMPPTVHSASRAVLAITRPTRTKDKSA